VVAVGDVAVVLTQNGGLALQEIQLAGKRAMAVADFLRGRPELIDSKLG
jgi:methionyl-tRNA formyltransferase